MDKIPNELQVVSIFGAEYFIDWKRFARGCSLFLPTTATPAQVLRAFRPAERHFDFKFEARTRREYGLYGVRVWRVY